MKKIFFNIFILGSGLAFSQTYYPSQYSVNPITLYGQDINSGNAKYIGVGGAVGALGGDISTTEQNPAGLGVALNSEIQFTGSISSYNNKNTFVNTISSKESRFNFNNLGASFVFDNSGSDWNRFSLGVNYSYQNLNNSIETGYNNNISYPGTTMNGTIDDTYRFAGYKSNIDGYKSKFSVNFATAYDNKLYLGLGLNFHDINYSGFNRFAESTDISKETFIYDQDGTPYWENGNGFSLSFGAIYKFNYNVRAGLAYHSPVWYNVDESFFAATYDSDDITTANAYKVYDSYFDLTRGGRFVGSLGFVLNKNFSLGVDYTYHMNNDTKLKPKNAFNESNNFINQFVRNSNELRVGGEYRIDNFKARLGYGFVQSPFKNIPLNYQDVNNISVNKNIKTPFLGNINKYSIGIGYDFGGFYIDAAYQHQQQKSNQIIGGANFIDQDLYVAKLDNNYVTKNKLNQNLFLVTFGWQF